MEHKPISLKELRAQADKSVNTHTRLILLIVLNEIEQANSLPEAKQRIEALLRDVK